MRRRKWFRRRKKELVGEHAQRFDAPFPAKPEDILVTVLGYIEDMLSDKRLVPSYLRGEMAAARRLPLEGWDLARESREECPPELVETRRGALEYAMRVALKVLNAQLGKWRL